MEGLEEWGLVDSLTWRLVVFHEMSAEKKRNVKTSASHRQTWGGETKKKKNIKRVPSSEKKRNEMSKGVLQGDVQKRRGGSGGGGSGSSGDGQYWQTSRYTKKKKKKKKRGEAYRQPERKRETDRKKKSRPNRKAVQPRRKWALAVRSFPVGNSTAQMERGKELEERKRQDATETIMHSGPNGEKETDEKTMWERGERADKGRPTGPISPLQPPILSVPPKKAKTVGAVDGATTLFSLSSHEPFFPLLPLVSLPRSLPHLVSGLRMRIGGEDQTARLSRFGLEEEKRKERRRWRSRGWKHGRGGWTSRCKGKSEPRSPNEMTSSVFAAVFLTLVVLSSSLFPCLSVRPRPWFYQAFLPLSLPFRVPWPLLADVATTADPDVLFVRVCSAPIFDCWEYFLFKGK
jgi:hypothetical protein